MSAAAMSDSDDDSLLGMGATFTTKRKSRAAERSRSNAMAYLDDALEYDGKRHALQERMERIKQEEPAEDYLVKAETLAASASLTSSSAKRRRELRDKIDGIDGEDNGMDKKRRSALAVAMDTGRSTLLGVRQTLKASTEDSSSLYHSKGIAIQKLKQVLKFIEQFGANTNWSQAVIQPLRAAIRQDSLTEFLCHGMLPRFCRQHNQTFLPHDLSKWLFKVACSGGTGQMSDTFAGGAFETLMCLWDDGIIALESAVSMPEIPSLLEEWFGLCWKTCSEEKENDTDRSPKVHPKALGLRHFLTICAKSLALRPGNVSTEDSQKFGENAINCLVSLERAGLDVTFHDGRG